MGVADRTVLVTGVSSGVGRQLTKHLVNAGATVIGTARSLDRLQELAAELEGSSGTFLYKTIDILKEEDVVSLFPWIEENNKKIDVLINNAGVFNFASLIDGKTEEWRVVVDTLVMGYSIFSREAIKSMKKNQISDGLIINIQSVSSKYVPPMGVYMYTASEHALDALGTGLRLELLQQQLPIRISKICPSLIKTEKVESNPDINKLPLLETKDIATAVSYILESPKHVEVSDVILRPVGSTI